MAKPKWLTDKDVKWLQQLADGTSKKQLEGATHSSARNRLFKLRQLAGAKTTEQLIAMAVKEGWVTVNG